MSKEDLCRGQGNLSVHLNPLSLSLFTAISGERTHSVDIRRWQRENDEMRGEQQGNVQLAVWQETNRNLFRNVNLLFYWYNDLLVKRLVCHSFAEVLQPCGEFIILSSVCRLFTADKYLERICVAGPVQATSGETVSTAPGKVRVGGRLLRVGSIRAKAQVGKLER